MDLQQNACKIGLDTKGEVPSARQQFFKLSNVIILVSRRWSIPLRASRKFCPVDVPALCCAWSSVTEPQPFIKLNPSHVTQVAWNTQEHLRLSLVGQGYVIGIFLPAQPLAVLTSTVAFITSYHNHLPTSLTLMWL